MKRCTKCKKVKQPSEFYKKGRNKDGLSYWCKSCESEYARKRYNKEGRRLKKYYRYEECHRVVDGVKEKRCRRCGMWKAESRYYKKGKHKDGLAVWCKECADKATNDCRRRRTAVLRAARAQSD
ncbi:MAG: hypothetical protein ACYS4W_06360 [Planctomycetota bacterium]|jgi:hypothetical protein